MHDRTHPHHQSFISVSPVCYYNLIHSGKSVVEIDDDENVYQKQGLNFEGTQNYHHTLQMESDDDDFPPPYFLRNENNYKTRHRDSFIY